MTAASKVWRTSRQFDRMANESEAIMNSYADHTPCEWRSGAAVFLYVVAGIVCWFACAWLCYGIGLVFGYPETGGIVGAFGIPILGVLVNGWRSK